MDAAEPALEESNHLRRLLGGPDEVAEIGAGADPLVAPLDRTEDVDDLVVLKFPFVNRMAWSGCNENIPPGVRYDRLR